MFLVMMRRNFVKEPVTYLLLLTAMFAASIARSVYANSEKFSWSGFGTLAYTRDDSDSLGFFRDLTQNKQPEQTGSFAIDSQLGVQLSYQFNPKFRATTQLVYADKSLYKFNTAVEWAFLGYKPQNDWDIRLGRMAIDLFEVSETRRIDYISTWMRPPAEMYAWITPYYIDGVDVTKSFIRGDNFWRVKLQYGQLESFVELADGSSIVEINVDDLIIASVSLDSFPWAFRTSLLTFDSSDVDTFGPDLVLALNGLLQFPVPGTVRTEAEDVIAIIQEYSGASVQYWQASANYRQNNWIFKAEVVNVDTDARATPDGWAAYINLGYEFNQFTPYAVLSTFQSDNRPVNLSDDWLTIPNGPLLRASAERYFNLALIQQDTLSLGVIYPIDDKLLLKFQWDHSRVGAGGYALWASEGAVENQDQDVNLISVGLNFIF